MQKLHVKRRKMNKVHQALYYVRFNFTDIHVNKVWTSYFLPSLLHSWSNLRKLINRISSGTVYFFATWIWHNVRLSSRQHVQSKKLIVKRRAFIIMKHTKYLRILRIALIVLFQNFSYSTYLPFSYDSARRDEGWKPWCSAKLS